MGVGGGGWNLLSQPGSVPVFLSSMCLRILPSHMGDNARLHLPATNYVLGTVLNFSMQLSMVARAWSPSTWEAQQEALKGFRLAWATYREVVSN